MTFAHPNAAARPARIRILGTTPPPPPPRRGPRGALLVACVVVAALGVGITLLARPQMSEDPSPEVVVSGTINLMGLLNTGARMPDERTLRVLRVVSPDFTTAARIDAARRHVARGQTPTTVTPPAVTAPTVSAPDTTGTAPTVTRTTPGTPQSTSTGPDQPPDPTSPNTFLDQS